MRKLAVAAAVTVAFAACKKAGPEDAELEMAYRTASDAQAVIEQALTAAENKTPNRDPEPAMAACSRLLPVLPRLNASEHAGLAAKLDMICRHDLPMAELEAAAVAVEADAGACDAVMRTVFHMSHILVTFERFDEQAKALTGRVGVVCPSPGQPR